MHKVLDGKVSLAVSEETQPQGLMHDAITSAGVNACEKGELAVSALQLFYWNFFMSLRTPWWSSLWVCGPLVPEGNFHPYEFPDSVVEFMVGPRTLGA